MMLTKRKLFERLWNLEQSRKKADQDLQNQLDALRQRITRKDRIITELLNHLGLKVEEGGMLFIPAYLVNKRTTTSKKTKRS